MSSAETLPDWLRARARAFPRRLAVAAGGDRLTFEDLDCRADRAARQLAGLGMAAGARVALVLGGGVHFAVLTHALARLGAVMVPVNTRMAPAEVAWCLQDARPALAICDEANARATGTGVRILTIEELAVLPEADAPLRDDITLSDVQGIIYTSATTGRPKGVVLTFGNHWWSAVGSAFNLGLRNDDCWLAPLPLYHVGGLAILWRSVIYGIPAVVHEAFDPGEVNREIDAGAVTIVSVVSTMLQRMLDERGDRPYPPTLRCVLLGGGPAPLDLIEECLRRGVPVAPTYGLTEAASQVATLPPGDLPQRPGSAGKALFPTEIKIEDGEILVRGPTVTAGYFGRPEETARVLKDGWLSTGDMGYLDGDGYLFISDRRDDLVISGGENVYPAEVERVLGGHPDVEDAGAFGLPDPEWGQAVAAAVTVRRGASLDEEDVRAFCAARLARYKVPKRIWLVDELPRSPSGKLIRRALREKFGNGAAPPTERRTWVRDAFHRISGRYDLLNHVLSGGLHVLWKRAAVQAAGLPPGGVALDVCCGTADLVLLCSREVGPSGRAIGVDFAPGMLAVAARRLRRAAGLADEACPAPSGSGARALLVCADAEALPLADGSTDAVSFAFGIRNVASPSGALREAHRVLRPGGRVVVLEFGRPGASWLRAAYDLYSRTIIPLLGGRLSGRRDAYQYLHDSVRQWMDPETLAGLMREAGFQEVRYRLLTGGIAVLHAGQKLRA
ncbi:MAG: o-succinylbenzoate--CoA ligase [Armatimonadetes bacterium]|nr:o-succinylbenzoate--CoA ligase [Armatimonadota bacterium]